MMSSNISKLFPGFETRRIEVQPQIYINAVIGGSGPPLLLLHGHPQTLAMWHKVAPALAEQFTVVAADLRGYGDSSKPTGLPNHENYSKRVLAQDQVTLMRHLGYERFGLIAHDRGARVAHRLAVDHPQTVSRLVLLDIAPTLSMYQQTSDTFARAYWHWFFLIQPASLPERLIEADPAEYIINIMGRRSAGLNPFDPLALKEYQRCMSIEGTAHSICEDYRASAGIDMEHERIDIENGRKIEAPLLVLWGKQGVIHKCFKPLEEWCRLANKLEGEALPCGHYIAEEAPDTLITKVIPFLFEED